MTKPVRITTAPQSQDADIATRRNRYLFSMAVRTACVAALFVVPAGWPQAVCIAGAVVLPYIAVIAANTRQSREEVALPTVISHRELN